jgi:hypothetical protein
MSYDLYFYKRKDSSVNASQIANYLTTHLAEPNEGNSQWFFENKATGVYFFIEKIEPEEDEESIELYESFTSFDNTRFAFILNYIRPSFFGKEAFLFVEKFITDLDLFVLNPQSDREEPYKPDREDLFNQWDQTNLTASAEQFSSESTYVPRDISNKLWAYNYEVPNLQAQLGEDYFVPRVFVFKARKKNRSFFLTTWTQHIPSVIPPADYFLLAREYEKRGKLIKDKILISRKTLLHHFSSLFEEFTLFKGCRIIHPDNAERAEEKFNALMADEDFNECKHVSMDTVLNAMR